jgi:hypothetical protein
MKPNKLLILALVVVFLAPLNTVSFAFDVPGLSKGIFLHTFWQEGFGRQVNNQNKYNLHIIRALPHWEKMDPLILKSLLLQESNFSHSSINRNGYAGIAQLGPREAKMLGLKIGKGVDQRLIPDTAIAACVDLMKIKAVRLENGIFAKYGTPGGDEYWKFIAASYNGGEAVVSRAMKIAYGQNKPDKVVFNDLLDSASGSIQDSPLYKAIPEFWNKEKKFKEISEFSLNVVNRARQ